MTLARNALHHAAGAVVPALAALATVPIVIRHLGTQDFGVLVLVMSVTGYASLLDLNLGTGATKLIAEYRAQGRDDAVATVFAMHLAAGAMVGLLGAAVLMLAAPLLVQQVFRVPAESAAAATLALRCAAGAFLIAQVQAALQGALHALQRFDLAGAAEAAFGTTASLAVVVAVTLGGGLVGVVLARALVSLVHGAWMAQRLAGLLPGLRAASRSLAPGLMRRLAVFSGWSSLSRFASVSAAHGDKLIIGALADARAVALYAVPFTLVLRVFGLAYRLSQVMYPRASELAALRRTAELRALYLRMSRVLVFVNAAMGIWLVALAPELLHHWAGSEFTGAAMWVMVWLVGAAVVDSLTQLPSLVNDGLGHPRNTGVAAVLRALAGLLAVAWGLQAAGIVGAAAAQAGVGVIAALLTVIVLHRLTVPVPWLELVQRAWAPSLPLMLALPLLAWVSSQREVLELGAFALWALLTALGLAGYGWFLVLSAQQRQALRLRARHMPWGWGWMPRMKKGRP